MNVFITGAVCLLSPMGKVFKRWLGGLLCVFGFGSKKGGWKRGKIFWRILLERDLRTQSLPYLLLSPFVSISLNIQMC